MLLVLPPLLALFGRAAVLAVHPAASAPNTAYRHGVWHRIAAAVARQARPGRGGRRSLVLAVLCTGLLGTPIGLSQTEQFRVKAESVSGYDTLAAHFPSGLTDPTRVIAATAEAADDRSGHRRHPRRGVGDPGRRIRERAEPMVGGAERRTGIRRRLRNR